MGTFRLMRAYDPPDGGYRILVDRLWPRGLARDRARLDDWAKDAAPSTELRTEFGHRPERFAEFREHYLRELDDGPASAGAERLRSIGAREADVVLVYAARDTERNHARVLKEYLELRR